MDRVITTAMINFTFLVSCTLLIVSTSHAADAPSYGMPSAINPSAKYLFYFHNYYVETKGTDGECKYDDILKAFADRGFIVISEIRPKDSSVVEYARKAAANIQRLLEADVSPENITVAGHSKWAVIAIRVASLLENPKVNYVIMAGCGIKGLEKSYPDYSRLKGNFLSVYATSDKVASGCSSAFSQSKDISLKEITLESAAGHQLFFRPTDVWLAPVTEWLKQKK